MQLERFLAVFPRDQMLVLENEDLRSRRDETLRTVFDFAGADPEFTDRRFASVRHKTDRKTRLSPLGERIEARGPPAGTRFSAKVWSVARGYWPLGHPDRAPRIREAIPDDVLEMLRADARRLERADRARLRRTGRSGSGDGTDGCRRRRGGKNGLIAARAPSWASACCAIPASRAWRMVGASVLHLVTLFVVARISARPSWPVRNPLFRRESAGEVLTIAVKPGTIRRTFAEGDDEDDEEDDEDVSRLPKRSLGTGLLMAGTLRDRRHGRSRSPCESRSPSGSWASGTTPT